jgi:hypothetical protein
MAQYSVYTLGSKLELVTPVLEQPKAIHTLDPAVTFIQLQQVLVVFILLSQ